MQTLQPTLRLGRDVWDHTAMPVEEFLGRADRLRAAMDHAALDAMLLYGRGLNECGHPTYLSNYIVKLPFSALVVLPRAGDPALMFEGATRGRSAAQATTWIEDVRPCWNMAETCLAVLAERGLTSATIGLAGLPHLMPHADWSALVGGLGRAKLMEADDLVWRQRAIKSSREIALVRRASQVVHDALGSLQATVRPAVIDEARVAAIVMREARVRGAEDIRLLIARPQERDWAFRPAEAAPIREGETVCVHLAASWERYWSEAIRTFAIQGGQFDLVEHRDLAERFRTLVSYAKPGVRVADWFRSARATMTSSDIRWVEGIGLGHGIGVTPEEPPMLVAAGDATIDSGMCMVVRAALASDRGASLHGDTIVVDTFDDYLHSKFAASSVLPFPL